MHENPIHALTVWSKKTPGEILDCDERQCCWLEIELGFACQKKLQARYWIATGGKAKRKKQKARKARLDFIAAVSELKDQKLFFAIYFLPFVFPI